MADDECDLEALLYVLDEDDDDLLASADHGNVEQGGDVTADQQEESGGEEEEEEEIQRQLQEMEAKMRAMKEKLSKKGKNGGGGASQQLAVTGCGDGNGPSDTAGDASQHWPPPKAVGGEVAASPLAARQTLGAADVDFRNGKSLPKSVLYYTVQFFRVMNRLMRISDLDHISELLIKKSCYGFV
jgi:hypothetical protein